MNKNKIIMSAIGGVAVVISLVLGYLTYAAWEEKEEAVDSLEGMKANVKRLSSAKIAPSQASVDAIEENRKTLAIWFGHAFEVAARGDRSYPTLTVAEFRQLLSESVEEARKLPGVANAKLVAEDFSFGFRDILDEGRLPKSEELPLLLRQWGDIKLFSEILSAAGVVRLVEVEKVAKKTATTEPQRAPVAQSGRNPRQQGKPQAEEKPLADAQSYTIKFQARPLALVKVLNELGRTDRFVVIDSLSFKREPDALDTILGGKEKEEARQTRSRRPRGQRGRGGRAAQQEEPEQQAEGEEDVRRKGLVVDPVTDTPFTVTMDITTYDFGTKASGEEPAEAAEGEEEQK